MPGWSTVREPCAHVRLGASVLYARAASCVPPACLLRAYCVPTACLLRAYCVPTACLLRTYCVPTACLLRTYCVPTAYLLRASCVPTRGTGQLAPGAGRQVRYRCGTNARRARTAYYLLLTTYYLLRTTYYLLRTTYYLLLTTCTPCTYRVPWHLPQARDGAAARGAPPSCRACGQRGLGLIRLRRSAVKLCPFGGSAPARLLRLLGARLAALGSSALPGRGRPAGRPAIASAAARARSCLQSHQYPIFTTLHHPGSAPCCATTALTSTRGLWRRCALSRDL